MTPKPKRGKHKLLNWVVDSLHLRVSLNRHPSQWLYKRLEVWRQRREAWYADPKGTEPVIEEIPGLGAFTVQPTSRHYEFVLVNPEICDIRIWNPDKWAGAIGSGTGQFYFAFRSRFLQHLGAEAALEYLEKALAWLCGGEIKLGEHAIQNPEFLRVSRADLAADTQEPRNMTHRDLNLYTCRARKRDIFSDAFAESLYRAWTDVKKGKHSKFARMLEHPLLNNKGGDSCIRKIAQSVGVEESKIFDVVLATLVATGADPDPAMVSRVVSSGSRQIQTVYFGRFGSELYARRYDKLASLEVQGKAYMKEVWKAQGWDGESPVWRTEFSLSGDFLKAVELDGNTLDLREVGLMLAAIPRLWAYLTHDWLRHCNPSSDQTPTRWQTSGFWKLIQGACEAATPVSRGKPEPKPDETQVYQQLRGCTISALALIGSPRFQRAVQQETGEVADPITHFVSRLLTDLETNETRAEITKRQKRFGLDFASDTAFSSLVRAEQMALRFGS